MAKRSGNLEELAREAVQHQARYSRRKAQALLDLLTNTLSEQHEDSTSDGLTQKQRELIDELCARFGYSEEEARERLRLAGG